MKNTFKSLAAAAALTTSAFSAQADILWSDISLTYLNGDGYVNPFADKESKGQVYTLEHAGAYNFGKSFVFVDRFNSGEKTVNSDETYMEVGVDLSLSWMTGAKLENTVMKDAYIATQWENANPEGIESVDNLLAGAGIRWAVPGFTFFDTNVYYRINETSQENIQLTTVWKLPFSIASANFVFDGFFDLTTPTEDIKSGADVAMTFHTQPQLKLDVGHFFDKGEKFYVGVELDYWKNKLGVKGQDQTAPQLLVQVHF